RPKSPDRPPLRDVFQIVPIVELIGVRTREIERGKQQTVGHCQSPRNPLLASAMWFATNDPHQWPASPQLSEQLQSFNLWMRQNDRKVGAAQDKDERWIKVDLAPES